ncbi:class I SAM-dependent methyltransferase [Ekhidna sp.]
MRYRERYMYSQLFKGLDLNGLKVADLASGSGANSQAIVRLFPDAIVTGYDISPAACQEYSENIKRPAYEVDLTIRGQEFSETYDVAMIVGGLHHCVADLESTFSNIDQMLKPGGILIMFEPNSRFFLEKLRKIWYRNDRYFHADTEEALSHDEILKLNEATFELIHLKNIGGPAYFLILNSLIFRIPLRLKPYIAPPLNVLEDFYSLLSHPLFFPGFIAQWRKR